MFNKNIKERFSIKFSSTDPQHIQAAKILNRQKLRSKAQYLVNAILHYEFCSETPNYNMASQLDAKAVEAIVNRVLMGKDDSSALAVGKDNADNISDMKNHDIDSINAIAQSLGSFRNR